VFSGTIVFFQTVSSTVFEQQVRRYDVYKAQVFTAAYRWSIRKTS